MIQGETPTDRLYQQGVPLDPKNVVGGIRLTNTESSVAEKDVDWTHPINTSEEKGYAAASATSHYHYQKISHLLLCDKIVTEGWNVPAPVKRVAELLAQQNAKEVKAWSEYMKKTDGGGTICPEQREYYQLLFNAQDVLPVLLGIQTINLAADTSYEEFYKDADPVFQKLADGFAEENQEAYNEIRDSFRNVVQPMPLEQRMKLLQNVAQQVDLCQIIYRQRDTDIFNPLGSNVQQASTQAGKKIKQFYKEIGLTDNIF